MRWRTAALLLLFVALPTACGGTKAPTATTPAPAGALISATRIGTVDPAHADSLLQGAGLPAGAAHSVVAYRLVYATVDARGRATTASGLVAVPSGVTGPLATVLYDHGTVVGRTEAPSALPGTEGAPLATFFAGDGFLYAAPDYLGLGKGPGHQAYLDAGAGATASRDLLRAVRAFGAGDGLRLSSQLLVVGYSEGGQAAMALATELTRHPVTGLRLAAVAPIAGPHDLSGATWSSLVEGAQPGDTSVPLLLSLLLWSWQPVYGLFERQPVFAHPDAATIARLFDGSTGTGTARAAIPASLSELLTPAVLAQLRHPSGALERALRRNDTCDVAPHAPVRIYHGDADTLVVAANAQHCLQRLTAAGGDARVVSLGPVGHGASLVAAVPQVRDWFREIARK